MKSPGSSKTLHQPGDADKPAVKSHKKNSRRTHAPKAGLPTQPVAPDRPVPPPYRANPPTAPTTPNPSSEVELWAELADRSDPGSSLASDGEDGRSSTQPRLPPTPPLPLQPLPKDDD